MVYASYEGAFMSKSEDKVYNLFEILNENLINHTSLSSYERSIPHQKWIIYKIEHPDSNSKTDLNLIAHKLNKVDILTQKLDQFLTLGQHLLHNIHYLLIIKRFILSVLAQLIM